MVLHSHAPEWSYEETRSRLLAIPNSHMKQFAVMSYVAGCRINEIRRIERKNVVNKPGSDGVKRILLTYPAEKNPHIETRTIPVNTLEERWYALVIKEWYNDPENKRVKYPFYRFSERWYRMKIREYLDIHPHAFRHLRVHHVDDKSVPGMKSLTPRQYQDYFGWETIATSSRYQSRTRARDLADNF